MKKSQSLKTLALLTTLAMVGCAKEKPFDEQYKSVELMSTNNFQIEEACTKKDENGKDYQTTCPIEYIYVPMTLGTPMNVTDADPFFQGDEKLVRLEWSEEGLEVREIERDNRFADNTLNQYPILTIPGEFKSFRCREDAYGECTNVEEENTELEWYDKDNFLPKFEDLRTKEVNMLDIFGAENSSCLSSGDTYLVNYEVSPGVINVELEKNYKVSGNWWCFIKGFISGDMRINGFRVRRHYSLVRRDMLASPGYKAVEYPERDHSTFGFFAREEEVLANSYDRDRKEKNILMERWKPGRTVQYVLSPEFSEKRNDYILSATVEAVGRMNDEMKEANIPLKIELIQQETREELRKKGQRPISPGDLRYTSLVLIEDPLANGLLGYGPAVSDPYTGEIVKAHTNMYLGVLKSMTRRTYQAAVDIVAKEVAQANGEAGTAEGFTTTIEALTKKGQIENDPEATVLPEALALAHFPKLIEEGLPELPAEPTPTPSDDANGDDQDDAQGDDQDDAQGDDQDDAQGDEQDDAQGDDVTPANNGNGNGNDSNAGNTPAVADANSMRAFKKAARNLRHRHNHGGALSHDEMERKIRNAMPRAKRDFERRLHMKDQSQKAAAVLERLKREGTLTKEKEIYLKEQARLDRYAENNALAVEFFPIGGTSKVVYKELRNDPDFLNDDLKTLKPFDSLTPAQQLKAQKIITRSAYMATLVHELGHNLGLRHNFMGSWDKDNFYSDEEARERGMEQAVPYSSIMDYSFSEFNQLKAFGKYDVAALKFGYSRKVDLADGQEINVNGSIYDLEKNLKDEGKELKQYLFCTDENAGLSTLCNRFDEGTSVLEVTNHLIERYKDRYKYSNFRDGRLSFNTYRELPNYIAWRQWEFGKMRDILEDYELYANFIGAEFMAQGCSPQLSMQYPDFCGAIKDRRDSVDAISDFFIEMVITPDHMCALVKPEAPTVIVEYRKLSEIYDAITSDQEINIDYVPRTCFDPAVVELVGKDNTNTPENDSRQVVGETGKFFNGFKDDNPNFRFAQDRYAFGIWPDKIFAFKAFFERTWNKGTSDDGHLALIDIPSVREKLDPVLDHLILGKPLENPLAFSTASGQKFQVPYAISFEEYKINPVENYFSYLKRIFNLPSGDGAKGDILLSSLHMTRVDGEYGADYEEQAVEARNLTAVEKFDGYVNEQFRDPNLAYYYDRRNGIKTTYAASEYNKYALKMIKSINNLETLEEAGRPLALKVATQKLNPQAPAALPVPAQVYWYAPADIQQILIDVAPAQGEEPRFTAAQFIEFFGQAGPALHAVYLQGAEFMQEILKMKEEVRNTIPADASDLEKALHAMPAEIVDDFAKGLLDKEVTNHYIEVLRKLPNNYTL